jgi:WD40 repeat protein/serine/threonine protein kinase
MTEREIFFKALDCETPEGLAAYLQGACGGDITLRHKVEELLKEHFSDDSLLAGSALEGERSGTVQAQVEEAPAQMIGRYKLLEKIGEGGFGEVWMAEQREPVKRRVALKILKPGMDSRQIVARFEAERQALAMMDHANIARIFDAGTTDSGRPYFVMELVRGIKITDYCDQQKLDTHQRLELFILVCQAIQHAHQKGIIHRDIKPSNILVTLHDGVPVPKVIDFGIAKATQQELTDKTLFTQFQQFIGTPAYISPEQAEMSGLDIDTRADIYSLGVLLYELLVGQTPFDAKEMMKGGIDALRQIIREKEPLRPSTKLSTLQGEARTTAGKRRQTDVGRLVHQLEGDLDWIVMKCLEKDRQRRYETANGLAADIQRHMNNEPVLARPPSKLYEFQKTLRRHKFGFAAAGAVLMTLTIGFAISTWQFVQKNRAYHRASAAEQEQARLRQRAEHAVSLEAQQRQRVEEFAERGRHNLYAARINLAQQAFLRGELTEMKDLLKSLQPAPGEEDLRGFEWYYLWRLGHSERMSLAGQADYVRSAAYSPDGSIIASAGNDRRIRLWHARTGAALGSLEGHSNWVSSVAFAPDGNTLASGSADQTVRIWDVKSLTELSCLGGFSNHVRCITISPDAKLLAAGSGEIRPPRRGSPGTRYAGEEGPGEFKVWDTATRKEVISVRGHDLAILSLAFTLNGEMLMTSSADRTVKFWEPRTGKLITSLTNFSGPVFSILPSPDQNHLATVCWDPWSREAVIKLWDARTLRELPLFFDNPGTSTCMAFSPDGSELATGGADCVVRVWDLARGRQRSIFIGHSDPVSSVAWAADGRTVVSASWDGTVKLWDVFRPQRGDVINSRANYSVTFSTDGKTLACGGRASVQVWDVASVQKIFDLPLEGVNNISVALTPDGKTLVAAGEGDEGKLHLIDIANRRLRKSIKAHDRIWHVAMSPDGLTVATCGSTRDPTVKLWNPVTGEARGTLIGHTSRSRGAAFSPDSRTLVSGGDNELIFWDVQSARKIESWDEDASVMALSPDGRIVAYGSRDDRSPICLREVATRKTLGVLRGHNFTIYGMAFSPDAKTLATASWDGNAKLWHVANGELLLTIPSVEGVAWCSPFSPDGQTLAIGSGSTSTKGGEILLLRAATKKETLDAAW